MVAARARERPRIRSTAIDNYGAIGGAIYAEGDVTMIASTITHSPAHSGDASMSTPGFALGGGVNALGRLTLLFGTLRTFGQRRDDDVLRRRELLALTTRSR